MNHKLYRIKQFTRGEWQEKLLLLLQEVRVMAYDRKLRDTRTGIVHASEVYQRDSYHYDERVACHANTSGIEDPFFWPLQPGDSGKITCLACIAETEP